MANLTSITSQYGILSHLSGYLSTLDLFRLGSTCRELHSQILASQRTFDVLIRTALCDGRGLRRRQDFKVKQYNYVWGDGRRIWEDEPIEVRLWQTTCDETGALPCVKCGINVCEECRDYPREPLEEQLRRRPHLNLAYQNVNVYCLCYSCDKAKEASLQGQHLNELCDCDVFPRRICYTCTAYERVETDALRGLNVSESMDPDDFNEIESKEMSDHQDLLKFLCPCGNAMDQDTRPGCTWCKRRHRPEDEWDEEMLEVEDMPDMIDEGPCYPPFIGSRYEDMRAPYPELAYDGPILQVPR